MYIQQDGLPAPGWIGVGVRWLANYGLSLCSAPYALTEAAPGDGQADCRPKSLPRQASQMTWLPPKP